MRFSKNKGVFINLLKNAVRAGQNSARKGQNGARSAKIGPSAASSGDFCRVRVRWYLRALVMSACVWRYLRVLMLPARTMQYPRVRPPVYNEKCMRSSISAHIRLYPNTSAHPRMCRVPPHTFGAPRMRPASRVPDTSAGVRFPHPSAHPAPADSRAGAFAARFFVLAPAYRASFAPVHLRSPWR